MNPLLGMSSSFTMDKVDKRGYLRSERKEKMTCHTFRSRKLLNESGGKKIKNEINKEPTIFCSYNKRFNMQKRNKKNKRLIKDLKTNMYSRFCNLKYAKIN